MSAPLALLRKRIVRQYGGHVKPWERKSCINGCVQGHSGCPLSDRSVVTGSTAVCRLASFFTYGSLIASQWCPQGTRFSPVPFGVHPCSFFLRSKKNRLCGGDQRALRSPFGNLRNRILRRRVTARGAAHGVQEGTVRRPRSVPGCAGYPAVPALYGPVHPLCEPLALSASLDSGERRKYHLA